MQRWERAAALASAVGIVAVLVVALPQVATPTVAARLTAPPLVSTGTPAPAVTPPAVPAAQTGQPVPVATPTAPDPAPPAFPPVTAVRAAVVVDLTEPAAEAAARTLATALDGVIHVAAVTIVATELGGVPADVALVDPREFRALTPQATADSEPLWQRIAAGDVAVTHEFGTAHQVVLGTTVSTGGVPLRVGAFASNGTPPIADAMVVADTPLTGGTRTLLIGLDPAASPTATAEALTDAGLPAEAVPDPRAPRDDIVIPAGGITPENVWDHLALCESSGDWQINTGNGYYGGLQFLPESWALVGGTGLPHEWPREEQIYRASLLWQLQGWEAWPQCARKLGLIVDPPPTPEPSEPAE